MPFASTHMISVKLSCILNGATETGFTSKVHLGLALKLHSRNFDPRLSSWLLLRFKSNGFGVTCLRREGLQISLKSPFNTFKFGLLCLLISDIFLLSVYLLSVILFMVYVACSWFFSDMCTHFNHMITTTTTKSHS